MITIILLNSKKVKTILDKIRKKSLSTTTRHYRLILLHKLCGLCPINVCYNNSYFIPFFSPSSFKIPLLTNSCKSRYSVFSETSETMVLKDDRFIKDNRDGHLFIAQVLLDSTFFSIRHVSYLVTYQPT